MVSSLRETFRQRHPDFPLLEAGRSGDVETILHRLGWIDSDENVLSAERAGEGNMNLTLRVRTSRRSVILKQSRPWVEKYDHIEAPWDRIHAERGFYQRIERIPEIWPLMPQLLGSDDALRLLLLEDLAPAKDLNSVYQGTSFAPQTLETLARFLYILHEATMGEDRPEFVNRDMRELNHAHIFVLPLSGNLDLPLENYEPGLGSAAEAVRQNMDYVQRIQEAGARYLGPGQCLIHGDYFPGSWLLTGAGARIIDPEFCFIGDPEFDLGVAVAHLALAGRQVGEASAFIDSAGGGNRKAKWIARYAAAEVMRRLIGVAQLPIAPTQQWRAAKLERSVKAAMNDDWRLLWE